ncbi:MAG: diadenylate cyclase CdaA [Oscillospiraceae bacterium]|nr:diadenylate cyclase CdaA [Oscillospiraceae bacterium]
MPVFIRNGIQILLNVMKSVRPVDIVDILLLSYLVYVILKLVRETRAIQLMKGIGLLFLVYVASDFIGLKSITFITNMVLNAGLIAIIVLFQPELRRALEKFGQTTFRFSRMTFGADESVTERWRRAIPIICEATEQLSRTNTGALIVIERSTKLGEQILNGTVMKAEPTVELFGNIFYPKTPLHDGAVIMRDGIIWAAACFLPKPQKEELIDKHLGSRHRAAIGMSENSDALVIVVSEETGQISVAHDGSITRNYTRETLSRLLTDTLIPPDKDPAWHGKTIRLPFLRQKLHGRKADGTASVQDPERPDADAAKEE